jgi:hypothetical protein
VAIHRTQSWTERTAGRQDSDTQDVTTSERTLSHREFHRPRTSLGVAGHWLHMAGVFIPVVIGELVPDPAKYRKAVRLASVGTAIAYEVLYTIREQKRREEQEAKLEVCYGRE